MQTPQQQPRHLKGEEEESIIREARMGGNVQVAEPPLFLAPAGAAPGVPAGKEGAGLPKAEAEGAGAGEGETKGFDEPVSLAVVDGGEEDGTAPDPPAAADNCAKPIDGGLARNTEYTFFYSTNTHERRRDGYYAVSGSNFRGDDGRTRKVAPMTQLGFPPPLTMLLPCVRSKMPPMHCELSVGIGPRFISAVLMGHDLPPKDMLIATSVAHAAIAQGFLAAW
jgi:hypothetical protein